jgi:hypothetical protein
MKMRLRGQLASAFSMKSVTYLASLFFCAASLQAQEQPAPPDSNVPVPINQEPHHHLILENSYVRVFRVEIISPDATLLHRHDFPYVYMSIGKAEFTNAVERKPEIRVKMADGQLGYSNGGFSHIIRTAHDTPFYNLTIELLHPQGNVRSKCAKVVNGPLEGCSAPQSAVASAAGEIASETKETGRAATSPGTGANTPVAQVAPDSAKKTEAAAPPTFITILETDESTLKSGTFPARAKTTTAPEPAGTLLVVEPLSQFKIDFIDGTSKLLSGGDSLWLTPGPAVTVTNISQLQPSALLMLGLKDAPKPAAN